MALASLTIRYQDEVVVSCEGGDACNFALAEIAACLEGQIDIEKVDIDEIDRLLDKATITVDQLIESIYDGVIVVNEDNRIILFNRAAEKIIGISRNEVIGLKATKVLENSRLGQVLKTGEKTIGDRQNIGSTTIITNRSPIIIDDRIIGAIATFQDITEIEALSSKLDSTIKIKETFGNILEYASDGICMINELGTIVYLNPQFEKSWNVTLKDALGDNIKSTPLNISSIIKAVQSKKPHIGLIDQRVDGVQILSNTTPIMINGVFRGVVIFSKEVTELQKLLEKLNDAEAKIKYFSEELQWNQRFHEAFDIIIGKSKALKNVLDIAYKASQSNATVLIHGESGTGKGLFAKAISDASFRKNKPFIRLNCTTIPENLLESELFGHVRGAFTGAIKDKPGRFELANGGTIFLDEIGDISKDMQVKLLRVLQEREFERVGGDETLKIDVRIIAATNKNLEKMVEDGTFREDLFYRLNVIPITLPPLRERPEDIPLLVKHFVEKICKNEKKKVKNISSDVYSILQAYHWPGNIRELENIIERAIALNDGNLLDSSCLPDYLALQKKIESEDLINIINDQIAPLEEYEKAIIKAALKKYKSYNKAGKALGITHRTVSLKAKKYGLSLPQG
ncbi:sigma 54-interacting transcriptional regulator [Alkaliphilus peptidifermentans]|nr:sigma 54-interacting transcriptional regulator [Alkaliphilus peptidifermentans]